MSTSKQEASGGGERSVEDGRGAHALQRHPRHRRLLFHPRWHVIEEEEEGHRLGAGFFNPTSTTFYDPDTGAKVRWYSREHRKSRFVRVCRHSGEKVMLPRFKLWAFEWGNLSWWVAQLFLWGSVAWCLNGHFLLFPGQGPSNNLYLTSYSALAGGMLFWVGAYLAVLEALYAALEVRFDHEGVPASAVAELHARGVEEDDSHRKRRWFFAETYRLHDVGYIAAMIQFVGATLFAASVVLGLPGVLPAEAGTNYWTWDATFWSLQTVGAWGFIISSVIFCLEVQRRWWKPSPMSLGWQTGFWNLIGALGFELSAIFGYWTPSGMYQRFGTSLSTYWGAWAFLIGSYFQLLETINKHPVEDETQ